MAEKEVLEIDVDSSKAEAALGRYNQLLNQHDSATEKAAASSAKLDQAISRSVQAYDGLASKLRNAGGAISDTFSKMEQSGTKVKTLNDQLEKQKTQYDQLEKTLARARETFGDSATETSQFAQALDQLGTEIASTQTDLDASTTALVDYTSQLDELVAGDAELAAAQDEVRTALLDVADAGAQAGEDLAKAEEATRKTGDAADKGKAKVDGMAASFEKLAAKLSSLPGPLGQAGQQLQGLLTSAEASGAVFEGLSGAAIAGGVAIGALALAIGTVKASLSTFVEYGSAVSEAAAKTKLSVEFISGFAEAADDASVALRGTGVELRDITGELEGFSAKIGRAVDAQGGVSETGKQLQRSLNELGVSLTDANGKLKDTPTLLADIADGFAKIGPGPQAEAIARTLDLSNTLSLLLQGREALANVSGGAVFTSADAQALKDYGQSVDELSDAFRNLKVSIASVTIGPLTSAIKTFNNSLKATVLDAKAIGAFFKGDFVGAADFTAQADKFRDANFGLVESEKQLAAAGVDAHDRVKEAIQSSIDKTNELSQATKDAYSKFEFDKAKEVDTRKEDVQTKRDNDSNLVKQQAADQAAARQAAAAERSAKATDALAKLQANLAKSADLVTAAFDGEVKALGRLETAKTLLDIVNGKSTVADFQKGQVAAGISEAVAKGQVPIAKGVAVASQLGKGNISPEAAALLLPAPERKTVLGNISAVNQGITDVNQYLASGGATEQGLLTDLANQRVPVVRRLTRNVPLQETAQGVVDAQANAKSVSDARAAALKQAEANGLSPAQLKVLGDSFNAPIEAANKAQKEAEAKYAAIKPKIDSTLATPFVAQQKQLAELGNQRDTTVRELKAAGKSQDEINKVTAEYNDKIKKQTETNEKTNKLLGAGVSTLGSTTETTTQVVGSRVIGTKGAQNIKDQIDKAFGTTGGETQIEVKLNAAGFEKLDELQQAFANLKRDDQIKLLVSLTGAKDAEELLTKLDNAPSEKEVDLALKASGTDTIAGLLQFINDPKSKDQEIKFQATLDAFGAKTPEEFKTKLALLSDSEIVLALKTSGIDDPEALLGLIRGQLGAGVTVPVKAEPVPVGPNNPLLTPAGFGLPPQITVPVTAGAVPPATTKGANDALDTISDKTVAIKGDNTDLLDKVTSSNKQVSAMPDRTILLLGDTTGIDAAVKNTNTEVDTMPNKVIYISGNHNGASQSIETIRNQLLQLPSSKTIEIHVKTIQETVTDKCFARGTPIATPRGYVPIEQIQIGDEVYAFDHEQGKTVASTVKQIFTNHAEWMCHLMFFRGVVLVATFTCTPGHPIWSENRQDYVAASDLLSGELVRDVNGDTFAAGAIFYTLGAETFNFEVEGHHNYFAAGILVHNASERVDRQIAGLISSLSRLQLFGAPGAYASAQRMISHTLLPQTVSNSNMTTNDKRIMTQTNYFQANSPQQVEAAFDVMQSMAEAR